MTDAIAMANGYVEEYMVDTGDMTFPVLLQKDQETDGTFRAWDMDNQQYLFIYGWTVSIYKAE